MGADDLTSSRLAPAPRTPLPLAHTERTTLLELGDRLQRRTWEHGLPDWFWGEGVCLLGMVRLARAAGNPAPEPVVTWLTEHARTGVDVAHVNNLAPGTAAALLAREQPALGELARQLQRWMNDSPAATRAPNGALEHWPDGVWADTTFMAGVFLGHLGELDRRPDLVTELGTQLTAHAQTLQDPATGLFAHGSHAGETIWSFWGRANAWCALSAVEYLELAARAPELVQATTVAAVRQSLRTQLVALARCQPEHGVWSVLVDDQAENKGVLESSAAAGIGAAMLRAGPVVDDLPDEVTAAGWRAVRGALGYVAPDGTLSRVSAGTVLQLIPFGYSVIRDDRLQLWGQGLALHAVAAAVEALSRGEVAR